MHKLIKAILHPRWASRRLVERARLYRGYAPPPRTLNVVPTFACNLRCQMCSQSQLLRPGDPMLNARLSLDHLNRLLDECETFRPGIMLVGGEPLLYAELHEAVTRIKQRGFFLSIFTNGLCLGREASFLVESGVDLLLVSLDGRAAINDRNRGPGAYEAAVEGVRKVIAHRKKKPSAIPSIQIAATISDLTYSHLSDLGPLALELGVDSLALSHLQYQTQTSMRAQVAATRQRLKACFTPAEFQAQMLPYTDFEEKKFGPIDPKTLLREMARLRKTLQNRIPLDTHPNLDETEIRKYYTQGDRYRRPPEDRCRAPYESLSLNPTGGLSLCMGYNCGHIEEAPLLELWNSPRTRAFRRALDRGGRFPVCHRCCN
jgi:MoaA/NifB/PqqE/SkfB family radical SAM enzyme